MRCRLLYLFHGLAGGDFHLHQARPADRIGENTAILVLLGNLPPGLFLAFGDLDVGRTMESIVDSFAAFPFLGRTHFLFMFAFAIALGLDASVVVLFLLGEDGLGMRPNLLVNVA